MRFILLLTAFTLTMAAQGWGHSLGHTHGSGETKSGGPQNPAQDAQTSAVINQLNATPSDRDNTKLAFLLVTISAIFSVLGAALPFFDNLMPRRAFNGRFKDFSIATSKPFLASSLGLSAGLLLSLSLGDLIPGSVQTFKSGTVIPEKHAQLVTTLMFMLGFASVSGCKMISTLMPKRTTTVCVCDEKNCIKKHKNIGDELPMAVTFDTTVVHGDGASKMNRLGIQIAASLAVHNFPEGLSTFTAAMLSPRIGVIYALALSLHKIPEGLMMALPLYISSGSRVRAFLIASSCAILSQFAGALVAFLLFRNVSFFTTVNGFIFAAVAGLLLNTVVGGILPMCHSFDPEDRYVTKSVFAGVTFFLAVVAVFEYL